MPCRVVLTHRWCCDEAPQSIRHSFLDWTDDEVWHRIRVRFGRPHLQPCPARLLTATHPRPHNAPTHPPTQHARPCTNHSHHASVRHRNVRAPTRRPSIECGASFRRTTHPPGGASCSVDGSWCGPWPGSKASLPVFFKRQGPHHHCIPVDLAVWCAPWVAGAVVAAARVVVVVVVVVMVVAARGCVVVVVHVDRITAEATPHTLYPPSLWPVRHPPCQASRGVGRAVPRLSTAAAVAWAPSGHNSRPAIAWYVVCPGVHGDASDVCVCVRVWVWVGYDVLVCLFVCLVMRVRRSCTLFADTFGLGRSLHVLLQAQALEGVKGLPTTSDVTRIVAPTLTPEQRRDVDSIRGHIVEFPTRFLCEEDLQPRGLSKEAMMPSVFM